MASEVEGVLILRLEYEGSRLDLILILLKVEILSGRFISCGY